MSTEVLIGSTVELSREYIRVLSVETTPPTVQPDPVTAFSWFVNRGGVTVAGPFPQEPDENTESTYTLTWEAPAEPGLYRVYTQATKRNGVEVEEYWEFAVVEARTPDLTWVTAEFVRQLLGFTPTAREMFSAMTDITSATGYTPAHRAELLPYEQEALETAMLHQLADIHEEDSAITRVRKLRLAGGGSISQGATTVSASAATTGVEQDLLCQRARAAVRLLRKFNQRNQPMKQTRREMFEYQAGMRTIPGNPYPEFNQRNNQVWRRMGY